MKLVGGSPVQPRLVLTAAIGGTILSAAIGVHTCCTPIAPPNAPEPPPIVVVDAAPVVPDSPDDAPISRCVFVSPKKRGGRPRDPRIVGGKPANPEAYPFAAGIATASGHQYCGGSVIGQRFVLTAAHCQVSAGDRVLVGSNNLSDARAINIVESRIHPDFNGNTMDYDVAVAVLGDDAGVEALPLATQVNTLDATVIGWGATCEGCSSTSFLREVTVPLWERCDEAYDGLTPRQLCAGLQLGGKDSCQGDSGGALLTWNVDHWEQLGIVSWGVGCARPNAPGVYSDLRSHELASWVATCTR